MGGTDYVEEVALAAGGDSRISLTAVIARELPWPPFSLASFFLASFNQSPLGTIPGRPPAMIAIPPKEGLGLESLSFGELKVPEKFSPSLDARVAVGRLFKRGIIAAEPGLPLREPAMIFPARESSGDRA